MNIQKLFIDKEDLMDHYENCELYEEGNRLIKLLNFEKEIRDGMYITLDELDKILIFKLRNQYKRQQNIRKYTHEHLLRRVSELALSIDSIHQDYKIELKINILSSLKGIHTATASAILTLIYPDEYAIIDRRNWRILFNSDKKLFSARDYVKYLKEVHCISKQFDVNPQVVDMALWEKDKRIRS
jgi:thermostable 8-oxoguanine DNA glycosylase